MTTTAVPPTVERPTAATDGRTVLACGLGGLAVFVGAAVAFADALAGSSDAAEAARALTDASGSVRIAVLLLTVSVLLQCRVVAELGTRTDPASPSSTLVVPFGVGHLVLLSVGFWAMAGAVSVAGELFDADVSPAAAEGALGMLNTFSPLAAFVAAGFFVALYASTPGRLPRPLRISALVMAAGLVVPVTGWAVAYLIPLWTAVAAVVLARSRS
jgi:hypothetical protein